MTLTKQEKKDLLEQLKTSLANAQKQLEQMEYQNEIIKQINVLPYEQKIAHIDEAIKNL